MRLVLAHADRFSFEATQEVDRDAAETGNPPLEGRMEDCVAVFAGVEADDAADPGGVADRGASEIRDVADRLNTTRVALYPCGHVTGDPAGPDVTRQVLAGVADRLDGYDVLRAPVGWHADLEVACKGHPHSTHSRDVRPDADAAERAGSTESEWAILHPDGDRTDPRDARPDLSAALGALVDVEVLGERPGAGETPPNRRLARERGIATEDPLSDVGHHRLYPRGALLRDALERYVSDLLAGGGSVPVRTPAAYDLDERPVREHLSAFDNPQYRLSSGDRRLALRPDTVLGALSILRDTHVPASDLPVRLHETGATFRREPRSDLAGLARSRASTVASVHAACRDRAGARREVERQVDLALAAAGDLGLEYAAVIRVTRAFHDDNRGWVEDLVARLDRPVLLERLPGRPRHWAASVEFATADATGRPIPGPGVSLDVESADRFDLTYSEGADSGRPVLVHAAPIGGVEPAMAALLERAAARDRPRLPTWLSPTQVRLVPVADDHLGRCESVADRLGSAGVRVDVDDREETVGRRVARAETDWIPYYAVVGDREAGGQPLPVTVRASGREVEMDVEGLRDRIADEVGDLPSPPRPLPRRVSCHPGFSGE